MTENERITAKEGGQGGLTEGQQAQLARNDKAVTSIRLQASFFAPPPPRSRLILVSNDAINRFSSWHSLAFFFVIFPRLNDLTLKSK